MFFCTIKNVNKYKFENNEVLPVARGNKIYNNVDLYKMIN